MFAGIPVAVLSLVQVADVPDEQDVPALELRAGEAGLKAGQEVTICYGQWPNDVFFLFFGFVPPGNPHDRVVLFPDAKAVVEAVARVTYAHVQ